MKIIFSLLFSVLSVAVVAAQDIQLAPPQASVEWVFASPTGSVSFDFRMSGADIRYTTDGSTPTDTSARYVGPIATDSAKTILARSFCAGYLPSEVCRVEVLKPGMPIGGMSLPPPSEKYAGSNNSPMNGILANHQLSREWLGYQQSKWRCYVYPSPDDKVQQVAMVMLQQQGSWIFLPQMVSVLDETGAMVGSTAIEQAGMPSPDGLFIVRVDIPVAKYRELEIQVEGLPALPDWHAGRGQVPWLFLDEVLLY